MARHKQVHLRKHTQGYCLNLSLGMEVKLLGVLPPITRMISPIRTRALKVPLTSSWTGSVSLVDTSMMILRAKISAGLFMYACLACMLLFPVILPVSFHLLLTNLIYIRSDGTSSTIPGFCTLYR
jgi:hypothetical protein